MSRKKNYCDEYGNCYAIGNLNGGDCHFGGHDNGAIFCHNWLDIASKCQSKAAIAAANNNPTEAEMHYSQNPASPETVRDIRDEIAAVNSGESEGE